MGNYINDLNELITAKSEIKNIIQDTLNENPSEVFSYYPSYIARIAASSEGPYVVSYSYLSENYPDFTYLYAYVADAVESGGGSVDLSSYVTYAYLASKDYVDYNTFNDLANEVYLDEDDGGGGTFKASLKDILEESGLIYEADADVYDVMDIQSTIDSTVEDYLTNSSYITASDLPVINENLIPKETNTYTLGDSTYYYKSTYSSNLVMNTYESGFYIAAGQYGGIKIRIANIDRFNIGSGALYPLRTGSTIGTAANPFAYTYTYNLVLENDTGLSKSVSSRLDINLNGDNKFYVGSGGLFPVGTKQLGSNGSRFDATYTNRLYLNGTNLEDRFTYLIWTGTSAQYAALDNYTTYQIYLIQEA